MTHGKTIMRIPKYIHITKSKKETKESFAKIIEAERSQKLLIVTSAVAGKSTEWLCDFLLAKNRKSKKLLFKKNDKKVPGKVTERLEDDSFDLCVGIGGGKILDIAKYASFKQKVKFISFPTQLSHDGIASPVTVIKEGKHWSESRKAVSPYAVIVDLTTVGNSPTESLLSGIADLTANLFASMDAEKYKDRNKKEYNTVAVSIARTAALLVFPHFSNLAIKYISEKDLKQLAWGLILSGIAMSIAGNSSPASGAEHKISHSIDYFFPSSIPHGFKVSLGNVISAFLHKKYRKEIVKFNLSLGLPVISEDIGIERQELVKVVLHARKIRTGRYTIIEETRLKEKDVLKLFEEVEQMRKKVKA